MKLTPVKLYTVNYHGDGALDADESVWAETPESAARQFASDHPKDGARLVHVLHPDGEWTFRIDDGAAPAAGGWVEGPPPKDEQWYLVRCGYYAGAAPATAQWNPIDDEFEDDQGHCYAEELITHYNPTPISLETP